MNDAEPVTLAVVLSEYVAVTIPPNENSSPTVNEVCCPSTEMEESVFGALTVTAHVLEYVVPLIVIEAVIVAEPAVFPVKVIVDPLLDELEEMEQTLELLVDQEIVPLLLEIALIVVVFPVTILAVVFEIDVIPVVPHIASA